MGKELKIGERYTWNQIKEAYPGKWVRVSDCNLTVGSGIIDGILVGVYSDDEVGPVQLEIFDTGSKDKLRRTIMGLGIGVIECLNAEVGVMDEP